MSSKSSKRIVLVDPLGDVLFSGESMIAKEAQTAEVCPETKRSAGSGVFPAAVVANEVAVLDAEIETEAPTQRKRDGRAA